MTLNGVLALILRYFTEFGSFGAYYAKVVEDRPKLFPTKISPKNLVFSNISLMAIFAEVTENKCIIDRRLHNTCMSESQSALSIWLKWAYQHYMALVCQSARPPVPPSVRLSVCHTRDPHINGSTYPDAFCTIRYSDNRCALSLR